MQIDTIDTSSNQTIDCYTHLNTLNNSAIQDEKMLEMLKIIDNLSSKDLEKLHSVIGKENSELERELMSLKFSGRFGKNVLDFNKKR